MARALKITGLPSRSLGTLTVALITSAALFGCETIVIDGVSTGAGGGGPAAGVGGQSSGDSTGPCSCSQTGAGGEEMTSGSGVATGAGGAEMTSGSGVATGAGGEEMTSGSSVATGAGGAGGAEMCTSDGDPCAAAADCCSGLCSNGACGAPSCAPDGDPCSAAADCCSELCSSGTCAAGVTAYSTSFEGACPDGWTLTGDWECGVPMNGGPAAAYAGTQCIATKIAGTYSDLQTWDGATATSPEIDLTNTATPMLTFRMWIDTEGLTYDGANLQISADGGMSYAVLNDVMPMYTLTIAGKPAWGGHQEALGWQLIQADLSGYAGQIIRLRFAFRSDSSGIRPGVYIDDILVD